MDLDERPELGLDEIVTTCEDGERVVLTCCECREQSTPVTPVGVHWCQACQGWRFDFDTAAGISELNPEAESLRFIPIQNLTKGVIS